MFLDILDMIFDSFSDVVEAYNVPLFSYGSVEITFWELILGIFTVSILFAFFLRQRSGSVFGSVENINEYEKSHQRAVDRAQAREYRSKKIEYYNSRLKGGK